MIIKYDNQAGVVLVLAMMIMSILLSVALGFGVFILSDLRQAKEIDNSITAYYLADSGIERTLFLFRKIGKTKISDLTATEKEGDGWDINGSTDYESIFFRQRLASGKSVKVYFLDRNERQLNDPDLVKSVKINWRQGDDTSSTKLQILLTQLDPLIDDNNSLVYYVDTNKVEISDDHPLCLDFKDKNLSGFFLTQPSNYLLELRVLGVSSNNYVRDLTVVAFNSAAGINNCGTAEYNVTYNSTGISNLTIKSVGSHQGARQEIYAHIPPFDPSSGLMGFVLFSAEDITKGY